MHLSLRSLGLLYFFMVMSVLAIDHPIHERDSPDSASTTVAAPPPPPATNTETQSEVNMPPPPPPQTTTTRCVTLVSWSTTRDGTYTVYQGKTTSTYVSRVSCAPGCTVAAASRRFNAAAPRPTATITTSAGRTVTSFACLSTTTSPFLHGMPTLMPKRDI